MPHNLDEKVVEPDALQRLCAKVNGNHQSICDDEPDQLVAHSACSILTSGL